MHQAAPHLIMVLLWQMSTSPSTSLQRATQAVLRTDFPVHN
jgi:hypothetical protein